MKCLSRPLLIVATLSNFAPHPFAREFKGNSHKHVEQSVIVMQESRSDLSVADAPQATVLSDSEHDTDSMTSMLATEEEVLTDSSPKSRLQKKLVALIWLEKVLQQNLDSMDEKAYKAKIAQSKATLEKETTPATAAMLQKMRTEMHEFSTPFYRSAVEKELKDIRKRQKAILDKILALESGADVSDEDALKEKAEIKEKKSKKTKVAKEKKKQLRDAEPCEEELEMDIDPITQLPTVRKKRCRGSTRRKSSGGEANMFMTAMVSLVVLLSCILCCIAAKVSTHVSTTHG